MGILQNGEEIWMKRLQEVKDYIDEYKKRPSSKDKDLTIKKLGQWILNQLHKYKNNIMTNHDIYNEWTKIINDDKYKEYFISNEEKWIIKLNDVKYFIDNNKKLPSSNSKDNITKILGIWCYAQKYNYEIKRKIMKTEYIRKKWEEFINNKNYRYYFVSNNIIWNTNLELLKQYIDINKCIPSYRNDKILYKWQSRQKENYKNKIDIMKNNEIYNKWTEFINDDKYFIHLLNYIEQWKLNFSNLKKYIDITNKRPKNKSYLSEWYNNQNKNYKKKNNLMRNKDIYDEWTDFINNDKYKQYLLSNEEEWNNNLQKLKQYIDNNNNIKPSIHHKNNDKKILANWISNQNRKYKLKEGCMKEQEIYDKWTNFINDKKYNKYFFTDEEE